MKFKVCVIFSATILALTACGGSNDDNTVAVNQPTKPTTNNQPFEMKEQIVVWKDVRNRDVYTINEPTTQVGQDSSSNNSALTKITVNGTEILFESKYKDKPNRLDTKNNGSKWLVHQDQYEGMALTYGNDTAYARYGIFNLPQWVYGGSRIKDDLILFYQGNPTSLDDMKKLDNQASDVAYKGQAIAVKQGTYQLVSLESTGIAQLTANFKNKTLKGQINQWDNKNNIKPITIDAQIRANTFAGTANQTGTVEGKFYGSNAANLAGAFNDKSQKLRGVFGAVKQ